MLPARRAAHQNVPLGRALRDHLRHSHYDQPGRIYTLNGFWPIPREIFNPQSWLENVNPLNWPVQVMPVNPILDQSPLVHNSFPLEGRPHRSDAGHEGRRCDPPRLHLASG